MTDLDHRVRVSDTEPGYSAAIRRARSPQWVRSCHLGPLGHVEPNAEENDRQNRMKSSRWPQQRPDQSTADTQINEIERAEQAEGEQCPDRRSLLCPEPRPARQNQRKGG